MGQYFKAVNLDRKEVICPWCMGGVAKLWEWAANPWGAVFTLLLRKSDHSGGGDYDRFGGYKTQTLVCDPENPQTLIDALRAGVAMEGRPIQPPPDCDCIVGRWAGERVVLIGDYDSSKLWDQSKGFHNISKDVVETWNDFIEIPNMKLKYNSDCSCQTKD